MFDSELDASKNTVCIIFTQDLSKRKVCEHIAPYELNEDQ